MFHDWFKVFQLFVDCFVAQQLDCRVISARCAHTKYIILPFKEHFLLGANNAICTQDGITNVAIYTRCV